MCKQLLPLENFYMDKYRKDKLQAKCITCMKASRKEYYKNNRTREIARTKERYQKSKTKILNIKKIDRKQKTIYLFSYLLEHPCIDCHEKDPVVLEFDHIKDKDLDISTLVKYSETRMKAEIEKCVVRCANCHRRKTAKERNYLRYQLSCLQKL